MNDQIILKPLKWPKILENSTNDQKYPKNSKRQKYPKTCKMIKTIPPKSQNEKNALNFPRMSKKTLKPQFGLD